MPLRLIARYFINVMLPFLIPRKDMDKERA
jgi:hypothetical protein